MENDENRKKVSFLAALHANSQRRKEAQPGKVGRQREERGEKREKAWSFCKWRTMSFRPCTPQCSENPITWKANALVLKVTTSTRGMTSLASSTPSLPPVSKLPFWATPLMSLIKWLVASSSSSSFLSYVYFPFFFLLVIFVSGYAFEARLEARRRAYSRGLLRGGKRFSLQTVREV